MKRALAVTAGLIVLSFLAWPYVNCWQLRQAVRTRDVAALQTRVDWVQLRQNLKPKLADAIKADADRSGAVVGAVKRTLGGVVAERGLDYLVTPANLARLLAGREFITKRTANNASAKPASPPANKPVGDQNDPALDDPEEPDDPMPPRRLRWAFFESPTRFRIEAVHPRVPNGRVVANLALQGLSWKLVDVDVIAR